MPEDRKTCKQCARHLPLSDFYKHDNNTDGHLGKCKSCVKVNVANNRRLKAKYYRAYEVVRYHRNIERGLRAAARRAELSRASRLTV